MSDQSPLNRPDPTLNQRLDVNFALQAAGLGVWELDPVSNTVSWDDCCRQLFGLAKGNQIPYQQAVRYIHPDDAERVHQAAQWAMNPASKGQYDVTYRTIGADDGKLRWVRFIGRSYFTPNRQLYRFAGIAQDVTRDKEKDLALSKAQQRFQVAFADVSLGVVITTPQGEMEIINKAFSQMTGYSVEELKGAGYKKLTHPDDLPQNRMLLEQLEQGQIPFFNLDKRYIRKDGTIFWVRMNVTRLVDEQGHTQNLIGIAQDITAERSLMDQLRQEQQRLTTILEQMPAGVLIADTKGELIYGNQQVEQIFRHPFRVSQDMAAYQNWQLFDPRTDQPFELEKMPMVRTLVQGETVEGVEMKLLRGDDSWGYAMVNSVPILNEQAQVELGVAIFVDITPRRQAEEALRQSEGRLRAVLESIVDGIYIGGADGIILANQVALDQLGFTNREELNRNIAILADEIQTRYWQTGERIPVERQAFARALAGEHVVEDVIVRHRLSGEDRVVRCAASPVIVNGQVVAAVAINTDVTELRRAEAALRQSEERYRNLSQELEQRVQYRTLELTRANQDLQRSNDNLQQFAYVASHDLQEPLRKIQAFGTLLEQQSGTQLGASGRDYLQRITAAGGRMSALIRDLLTYSRISTRQQEFGLVSLNAIVSTVLNTLEWEITNRQAQVEVDELPILSGDESQLGQLFQNLLSNALKFTPLTESPSIRVSCAMREVEALPEDVKPISQAPLFYQISVSDQGVGFDVKYRDRIFQVFQRLHSKEQFAGTGVGLAICQRVVENHGGGITADSQPGQGATFYVYLPA